VLVRKHAEMNVQKKKKVGNDLSQPNGRPRHSITWRKIVAAGPRKGLHRWEKKKSGELKLESSIGIAEERTRDPEQRRSRQVEAMFTGKISGTPWAHPPMGKGGASDAVLSKKKGN